VQALLSLSCSWLLCIPWPTTQQHTFQGKFEPAVGCPCKRSLLLCGQSQHTAQYRQATNQLINVTSVAIPMDVIAKNEHPHGKPHSLQIHA
jgi:hypothetical protein